MKQLFRITIQKIPDVYESNWEFYEEINGASVVEILSKLVLTIAKMSAVEIDYIKRHQVGDDDIPF